MGDVQDTRTVDDVRGDAMSGKLKTEDDLQSALKRLSALAHESAERKAREGDLYAFPQSLYEAALALHTLGCLLEALADMPEAESASRAARFEFLCAKAKNGTDYRQLCNATIAVLETVSEI